MNKSVEVINEITLYVVITNKLIEKLHDLEILTLSAQPITMSVLVFLRAWAPIQWAYPFAVTLHCANLLISLELRWAQVEFHELLDTFDCARHWIKTGIALPSYLKPELCLLYFLCYSFVTEPVSSGLNVALKSTCEKSESKAAGSESLRGCSNSFGIPEAAVTSSLCSCTLKSVKYCDGSYIASLSPV